MAPTYASPTPWFPVNARHSAPATQVFATSCDGTSPLILDFTPSRDRSDCHMARKVPSASQETFCASLNSHCTRAAGEWV